MTLRVQDRGVAKRLSRRQGDRSIGPPSCPCGPRNRPAARSRRRSNPRGRARRRARRPPHASAARGRPAAARPRPAAGRPARNSYAARAGRRERELPPSVAHGRARCLDRRGDAEGCDEQEGEDEGEYVARAARARLGVGGGRDGSLERRTVSGSGAASRADDVLGLGHCLAAGCGDRRAPQVPGGGISVDRVLRHRPPDHRIEDLPSPARDGGASFTCAHILAELSRSA